MEHSERTTEPMEILLTAYKEMTDIHKQQNYGLLGSSTVAIVSIDKFNNRNWFLKQNNIKSTLPEVCKQMRIFEKFGNFCQYLEFLTLVRFFFPDPVAPFL